MQEQRKEEIYWKCGEKFKCVMSVESKTHMFLSPFLLFFFLRV